MKNKIIIIIFSLLLWSCKTPKAVDNKHPIMSKEKKEWLFAFKANTFFECLKYSGVKIEKDASPSLNFEILGDFKLLSRTDSLGKNYSKIINDRGVWLKEGDLDGYKSIVNGCLIFYGSKELDSIAEKEYKKAFKN